MNDDQDKTVASVSDGEGVYMAHSGAGGNYSVPAWNFGATDR